MTYRFSNRLTVLSLEFIRAAREEAGDLGADRVYAMMDAFDPELRDELMFRLIVGDVTGDIKIRRDNSTDNNVIGAIRSIRFMSGLGLKESKDVTDAAIAGGTGVIKGDWSAEQRNSLAKDLLGTGFIVV
jgi:ribosomal protein L7/L12